jgi:L-galactose dehydrogenase
VSSLPRKVLGATGLEVSIVSLGTGSIGEFFGPLPEKDAASVVDAALELGINLIDTSPYYGSAEERLGRILRGRRDELLISTKAGRYGDDDFDYSPGGLRESVEHSLRLLGTDHVEILLLHDIEFVPLGPIITEALPTLRTLCEEGKTRYIGVSGYPLATIKRIMAEADIDVALTYAHGTLLDDSIRTELTSIADHENVGLVNAAPVMMGLLTPSGARGDSDHRASPAAKQAAARMNAICSDGGANIAFVASQYSIQRSGCATTLIGTGRVANLESAVRAATTPIDDALLNLLLAERPEPSVRQWLSGLRDNN